MKEYKIIRVPNKEIKKDFAYAEKLLADRTAEGWRVVSVCPDLAKDLRGDLLITLERETDQ